ncbi:RecX family transcriptional regulator [Nesterenkonia pannonica]|uniref:regulatory protein RecX n=1 Tax=Nesterenkonia pannonica TaxID=1548602 RepID=UPI002164A174|nr:regulatory protein RecX [Nesterenkonia pannonica]
MADPEGAQPDKLDKLRQTLEKLESGELRSDLFDAKAAEAPADSGKESAGAPGSRRGLGVLESPRSGAEEAHRFAQVPPSIGSGSAREGIPEETIVSVLDRMQAVQLIDDEAFAHTWVRTRHELKGLGASALRRELQDKGIEPENIEAALDQLSVEDQEAAARELVENKLRGVAVPSGHAPEDRKERTRSHAYWWTCSPDAATARAPRSRSSGMPWTPAPRRLSSCS